MIKNPKYTRRPLVVLRFRDINVNTNETIKEHRRAINDHGSCWWGWLARDWEKNPADALNELWEDLMKCIPFEVLLYDTGQGLLFSADCEEMVASYGEAKSPDLALTPNYYRERRAPAWFRLSSISKVENERVTGRRCIMLPSAVEDCFTDLLDKEVKSLLDLRRQEVTLWILQ